MTRIVYQAWQRWDEPEKLLHVRSSYDRAECQRYLDEFAASQRERGYGADHYWVDELEVDNPFEWPEPQSPPRERYHQVTERIANNSGWDSTAISIIRNDDEAVVAQYTRNYPSFHPFEPFRQNGHEYALIAPDYTATSVVDLATGEVIASEPPDANGFCPVDFYVPDWWEVHDASIPVGSHHWEKYMEQPNEQFGFVSGCFWGDDSSWKVQYLDLSHVTDGVIARDDRFGYVEVQRGGAPLRELVRYSPETDCAYIDVTIAFDLATGAPDQWSLAGLIDPAQRKFVRPGEGLAKETGIEIE